MVWETGLFLINHLFPLPRGCSAWLLDIVEAESPVARLGRAGVALHRVSVHVDDKRFHKTC